ncbi:unnamed protein product [Camellia sinensis]
MAQSVKPISSPVPDAWYPTLAVFMLAIGLVVTASFFIGPVESYEATSSRKNRCLAKELTTGAVASVFLVGTFVNSTMDENCKKEQRKKEEENLLYLQQLSPPLRTKSTTATAPPLRGLGFGSLFLLIASGVYV